MDKKASPVGLEGVWEVGEVIGHELCVTIVVIPPYKKSLNLKDEIFKLHIFSIQSILFYITVSFE